MVQEFNSNVVEEFLCNVGQRFAQVCWHNDMVVDGNSTVSYDATAKWFKLYFPSNVNQYLFRLLEAHVQNHTA